MSLAAKLRRAPTRLATGAYILNSGLGKLKGNDQTAAGVHGMAKGAYPFLSKIPPKAFLKGLAIGEITVGSVLLLPMVPAGVAGLVLTGFAGGLLGMYARTPSLHDDKYRPTQAGTAIAKDIWMGGIGVGLIIDAILSESRVTKTEA
jgi:hypothetical protein